MDKGAWILVALVAIFVVGVWSAGNDIYQSEEVARYEQTGKR